jgi:uncharacterized protein with FMN-binding domain
LIIAINIDIIKHMKNTKVTLGIIVFIIFCIGAGIIILQNNTDTAPITSAPVETINTTPTETTPVTTAPTPSTPTTPAAVSQYKDGTYQATGSYNSPAGMENVGVSITLKNDTVIASTVTNEAADGESRRYQDSFISGYKPYVTGKNINDIKLGKVSRSSLTGTGFNAALTKIKTSAKA